MLLPPELVRSLSLASFQELRFDVSPIQLGLCRSPWHVVVSSVMLQRCRRMPSVHRDMFRAYPTPALLACSDTDELQQLLQPLGFHRTRARYLQQLSWKWDADGWSDVRDLPGVGPYVADAVQLFCFDCVDMESNDSVLKEYACSLRTR